MTVITGELLQAYFLGFMTGLIVSGVTAFAYVIYKDKIERLEGKIERLEERK